MADEIYAELSEYKRVYNYIQTLQNLVESHTRGEKATDLYVLKYPT